MHTLRFGLTASLLISSVASAQTQSVTTSTPLLLAPGGRALATIASGASVEVRERKGDLVRVSLRGFVDTAFLGPRKDSFPVGVKGTGTVRMRASSSRTAAVLADLNAGMGLSRLGAENGFARVQRVGWIAASALGGERKVAAAARSESKAEPKAETKPVAAPAARLATNKAVVTPVAETKSAAPSVDTIPEVPAGSFTPVRAVELRTGPDGRPLGSARPGATMTAVARDRGWVRVRVEGWVPEKELAPADAAKEGLSAADLRADPDATRGRVVHWQVQVLALQTADPLRRDLIPDEPYLLAKGPGNENALLYLAVPPSLLATAKAIPSLTQVTVTARVRNGKSEPVGIPILDLQSIVKQ